MLILKRKNLVISMLVILLIITGYLNFAYNQNALNDNNINNLPADKESGDPKITISDAVDDSYDSSDDLDNQMEDVTATSAEGSFFANYRLERENTRKTEIEYIKEIVNNPNSDPDMKKEAQAQLLEITNNMEKEMTIEGLIKAKGFEDVIVIMSQNSVNVIVDKDELKPEEVAQILDIVKRESGKSPDSIKIIPVT